VIRRILVEAWAISPKEFLLGISEIRNIAGELDPKCDRGGVLHGAETGGAIITIAHDGGQVVLTRADQGGGVVLPRLIEAQFLLLGHSRIEIESTGFGRAIDGHHAVARSA
jgi:hypothetical protein